MALDQEFDLEELQKKTQQEGKEMSFLDHIDELRWHLIRALLVTISLSVLAFIRNDILFDQIIFGPMRLDFWTYRMLCDIGHAVYGDDSLCLTDFGFKITNITMSGQFTSHMFISFLAGIILGFPYILWEMWRFIKPALNKKEKSKSNGLVLYGTALFLCGLFFGYFFLTPISVSFMGSYSVSGNVENFINLESYISFVSTLSFGTAVLFELPLIIYFLARMGIVTAAFMKKYRSYAFVIILVLAAVVTPPDVISQIMMTIPLYGLYELGIWIAGRVEKRQAQTL